MPDPYEPPPSPAPTGVLARCARLVRDGQTWRDWLWVTLDPIVGGLLAILPGALFLASFWGIGMVFYGVPSTGTWTACTSNSSRSWGSARPCWRASRAWPRSPSPSGPPRASSAPTAAGPAPCSRRARPRGWPTASSTCPPPVPTPWTPRWPRSAASNATSTTAPRPAWWPWA
ncbi:hypothetical protein ACFQ2B_11450 [Streptomyces stramineus]